MTQDNKHTSLNLEMTEQCDNGLYIILRDDDEGAYIHVRNPYGHLGHRELLFDAGILLMEDTANAVIRACNLHYKLLEALKSAKLKLEGIALGMDSPVINEWKALIAEAEGK